MVCYCCCLGGVVWFNVKTPKNVAFQTCVYADKMGDQHFSKITLPDLPCTMTSNQDVG